MHPSHDPLAPVIARAEWQTESWRLLRDEWLADGDAAHEARERERQLERIRPEVVALLGRFTGGVIGLEELRATIDRKARTDWDALGLRGSSGAMYLNALARQTSDPVALADALRAVLRVPLDASLAERQLQTFLAALVRAAPPLARHAARQGTRAVFLASVCWHAQEPDRWPAFHLSARRALHAEEELFVPSGDPVRDYLAFRESFLSLAAALRVTSWQLEHLCRWHDRRLARGDAGSSPDEREIAGPSSAALRYRRAAAASRRAAERVVVAPPVRYLERDVTARLDAPAGRVRERVRAPADAEAPAEAHAPDHTQVQWLLATLGARLGCRVWIAPNERRRRWGADTLGALSIGELPELGLDPASQRVVAAIDVVWLTGARQLAAAFEVEHTTAVYSGLLRLADLVTLAPNLVFPLYVVAPESRMGKVRRELSRPTFRQIGLHERCGFFSGESLLEAAASLARWGSDPRVIERLAERVG